MADGVVGAEGDKAYAPSLREGAQSSEQQRQPSRQELQEYHALMSRLQGVDGLRSAAEYPNGSVFWDFKMKCARPGRIWHDESPDWLKKELLRKYTDEEMKQCREGIGIDKAAPHPNPTVVVVMGPGAAGKSTALEKAAKMLDIDVKDFVNVDGDDMRSCHQGWHTHIEQESVNGYKDAFDIWRDNPDMKLKEKFMKEAMDAKKNLLVPLNKKKPGMLEKFKEKGYVVYVLGMLTSSAESKARCINRANENGRYPGSQKKAYLECMDDLVEICRPQNSDKVVVFDSTDFADMKLVYSRVHDFPDLEKLAGQYKTAVASNH